MHKKLIKELKRILKGKKNPLSTVRYCVLSLLNKEGYHDPMLIADNPNDLHKYMNDNNIKGFVEIRTTHFITYRKLRLETPVLRKNKKGVLYIAE
jgi:hypothetical protein